MKRVKMFFLGYIENKSEIKKIVNILNKRQNFYIFEEFADVITINPPDIDLYSYSKRYLIDLLKIKRNNDESFYQVGIISASLEGNYYSIDSEDGLDTILTLKNIEEVCELANRSRNEYLILSIITQLSVCALRKAKPKLSFEEVWHLTVEGCVFDFCQSKIDKKYKLQECSICNYHKSKFDEVNLIGEKKALIEILNYIKKPSLCKSYRRYFIKPLWSFFYGGVIGGLIINILSSLFLGSFDSTADYCILYFLLFGFLILSLFPYTSDLIKYIQQSFNQSKS